MPKFLAVFSVLFCLLSQPVAAKNQFIRCVQNQLTSLSFNTGPADGSLGGGTRRALKKLRKSRPDLNDMPDLTNRFAVNWCRKLGAESKMLAQFMPSAQPAKILYDKKKDSTQGRLLFEQYFQVRKFYADEYDIKLASRVDLAASHSVSTLVKRLDILAQDHNRKKFSAKGVQKQCNSKRKQLAAFASRSLIGVCFLPKQVFDYKWFTRKKAPLGLTLAHEYFHQIQRELAADKLRLFYKKGHKPPRRYMWPSWMVEGGAEVFGYLYLEQEMGRLRRFDQVFRKAYPHKQTLRQITRKPYLSDGADYQVSFLATEILARRFGPKSLVAYWQAVGTGLTHEDAFLQAFGMTLTAYEKTFETLRTDIRLAQEFIQHTTD